MVAPLLRAPARLDRPGLRWALRLCSPFPILVLTHRGRRSGRLYRTPLELLTGSSGGDMFALPLAGHRADWYRNVIAGGLVEGSCRGRRGTLQWRRASAPEARHALDDYRHTHPLYTRALLFLIARINDLAGRSSAELVDALPILVLRFDTPQQV
jgi:deazaflavin-dependent oxidoreductase (nitroreductase family)